MEAIRPMRFFAPWTTVLGVAIGGTGAGLAAWAVAAAGSTELADPDGLVTTGPYRLSRHPMYAGWTMLYLGLALVVGSGWMLVLLPALAAWVHRETGREEARLTDLFGSEYGRYRGRVRRYL